MDVLIQVIKTGFFVCTGLVMLLFILIFLFRRFKCENCGGYFPGWKVITWIASPESSWDDKYLCKKCAENMSLRQKNERGSYGLTISSKAGILCD